MEFIIKQEEDADELVRQHLVDTLFIKEEETDADMRARLVESLSASFPGCALTRALAAINDEDLEKDPLSKSCYAELRLEKGRMEVEDDEDDELTSLEWLQETDLLKNISTGDRSLCASPSEDQQKENVTVFGQTHPPHVPYNPQKHINSKPPYSFSCLIFMAIEDSPIKKLPVKDIYNWILTHFPYFRYAPTGWKNSVRHNLSLNKCFKKVEKEKGHGLGKGSLWCIDPMYRPNLLQALRKTPYHPYHQLQMLSSPQPPAGLYTVHGVIRPGQRPLPLAPKLSINSPSPHLFPFLSKRLSQSGPGADIESLGDSDIDVANTLMSLKRAAESRRPLQCKQGARSRSPSPPEFGSKQEKELLRKKLRASLPKKPVTCTAPPSDDHMYCVTAEQIRATRAALSPGSSSIDEGYEFGNDEDDNSDDGQTATTKKRKTSARRWSSSKFDRSHSDIECTDSSDLGSDGEHRSRVRGLQVRITNNRKRKRKASRPVPLYKKRLVDTEDEDEEKKIVAGADALLNLASAALSLQQRAATSPDSASNNNNNNDYDKPPLVIKEESGSDTSS